MDTATVISAINTWADCSHLQIGAGGNRMSNPMLAKTHPEAYAAKCAAAEAMDAVDLWTEIEKRDNGAVILQAPDGQRVLYTCDGPERLELLPTAQPTEETMRGTYEAPLYHGHTARLEWTEDGITAYYVDGERIMDELTIITREREVITEDGRVMALPKETDIWQEGFDRYYEALCTWVSSITGHGSPDLTSHHTKHRGEQR